MARKHALIYVRKDGTKVPVWSSPVGGQLRFTAEKRTAIDGKEWWLPYDNETGKYLYGRCKMLAECRAAITRKLEKGELPFVPYDDGTFKKGKHKFAVDVHWVVARSYEVEATNRKEAQKIVQGMVDRGEVSVWSDGFEATDDVEVRTSGEEKKDGGIQYF